MLFFGGLKGFGGVDDLKKYEWNGPPQPQMVGFCDLVGTDFAPVSNKTAVKALLEIEKT